MDKRQLWKDLGTDPKERLKSLSEYASSVSVDPHIPIHRYYRSGIEMVRLAHMHMEEQDYESAYTLYMKFITLFVDKIIKHPQYNSISAKDRNMNKCSLRTAFAKAEELKKQLMQQYQIDLDKYIEDLKEKEKIEMERLKQEELQKQKEEEEKRNKIAAMAAIKAATAAISTNVVLPEETKSKLFPIVPPVKPVISPSNGNDKTFIFKDSKTPTVDRSTKPSLLMSDGLSLRDVILSNKLMHDFLMLAFSNTINNKETCGILAGKLERNKLLVTHLLIPEQTSTPDSCTTHNEEDLFDYQDQHNLITLGWIHTHPTQTAFLSSVDLHTHCAYQLLMAEAIAIVCAPKYDETGFFVLTPDYGLDFIANCRETGFHPHPTEQPLYTKARHYKLDAMASIEVVDLRRK
ncbi:STAM-binding protein [Odontomachus brunneus]|uniref:STAM-binding protein n=1 Tax=Odontomachus brunneus TaxID=486640 RepID=UPI0013F1FB7E|nr:STAM-binding protein [Odontomachus brunneus]XP_032679799.1 STAM-binding protein [Odontomachus brunneus]XP_032679800.1 STAM-binding protein [Odontomachus brunneus]